MFAPSLDSGKAFLQTGPFGTALKANEYTVTGVPLISVREIREGYFQIEEATPRVDQSVLSRLPKFVLKTGDIVFARKGGIERNALITETENGWFLGSDGIFLRFTDDNDSRFFSYVMRSPSVKAWLIKNCEGTTMPSLNQKILSRLPVYVPLLEEQMKVADWLEALDNKITLNRQINQTLEQMAQALFKSWFVDFDPVVDNALDAGFFEQDLAFPDELLRRAEARKAVRDSTASLEKSKPLPDAIRQLFPAAFEECAEPSLGLGGWVPQGWKPSNVGAEFDVTMGQSPPGSTYNEIGDGMPFFQGKTDFGFRFPSNRVYCTEPKRLARKHDTLISVRAPVGDINLAAEDCAIGRGLAAARHKSGSISFSYYSMNSLSKYFEVFEGEGTVFGSINQKDFNALPLIQYPSELITKFGEHCERWDQRIENITVEVLALTSLRDTLLPKLISGELRLDEIEVDIAEQGVA
ncbi:restriction endonuclease subunit S [Aeromonas caviae]|uniref:restriction endonuclease subunit S n=1 Tax=Aeromonas caviae TaxID=648 RepID=UPI0038D13113